MNTKDYVIIGLSVALTLTIVAVILVVLRNGGQGWLIPTQEERIAIMEAKQRAEAQATLAEQMEANRKFTNALKHTERENAELADLDGMGDIGKFAQYSSRNPYTRYDNVVEGALSYKPHGYR